MKFQLNWLSGGADRKLQVSFLNSSLALYPADLVLLANLIVTRGKFLKTVKKPQNCSDFISVTIYFYSLTNFFAEYKFSHAVLSRIRPRTLQTQVILEWTAYLKFLPQYNKTQKFKHYPNYIKNENHYSKPEHRLSRI